MTTHLTTPEVHLVGGKAVTTSRAVAAFFGRQHHHVVQKIENLDCSVEFLTRNFSRVPYLHNGNTYTEYQITRDGFTFLAMGFTGKKAAQFKEAYIEAFNALEQQREQQLVLSYRRRFLMTLEGGQMKPLQPLSDDAFIARFDTLPQTIDEALMITNQQLSAIAAACVNRLRKRADLPVRGGGKSSLK